MRKDQRLRGAALTSAARREARESGYAVVIRHGIDQAMAIAPDGSYQLGLPGTYGFCLNFGPGSPN